jgi:hypothetical protein
MGHVVSPQKKDNPAGFAGLSDSMAVKNPLSTLA